MLFFAGSQLMKALSLKKAPDYDVERYFWRPPPARGGAAPAPGVFPSLAEPASVTLSVVVRLSAPLPLKAGTHFLQLRRPCAMSNNYPELFFFEFLFS